MAQHANITPRARQDLENIWNYSVDIWGEAQADDYIKALYHKFTWLAEHPYVGKSRDDIFPNYYSFPHREHVIFYIPNLNDIAIIGVLHKKMDVFDYFDTF